MDKKVVLGRVSNRFQILDIADVSTAASSMIDTSKAEERSSPNTVKEALTLRFRSREVVWTVQ